MLKVIKRGSNSKGKAGYMAGSTQWGRSQVAALIRIRTRLKFQALKHPMGRSVESCLNQMKAFPFWDVTFLALNCVAWLIIWAGLTVVHTVKSCLTVIFILPIKKLLDLLQGIRRKLSYTVSCMVQETTRSVKSLVKVQRRARN